MVYYLTLIIILMLIWPIVFIVFSKEKTNNEKSEEVKDTSNIQPTNENNLLEEAPDNVQNGDVCKKKVEVLEESEELEDIDLLLYDIDD